MKVKNFFSMKKKKDFHYIFLKRVTFIKFGVSTLKFLIGFRIVSL